MVWPERQSLQVTSLCVQCVWAFAAVSCRQGALSTGRQDPATVEVALCLIMLRTAEGLGNILGLGIIF